MPYALEVNNTNLNYEILLDYFIPQIAIVFHAEPSVANFSLLLNCTTLNIYGTTTNGSF
jgi:hypothetical protein